MRAKGFLPKRDLRTVICLFLSFSMVGLVHPVFAEPLSMNVFSRVDSGYNYVVVDMRLGVNVSQSISWSSNVEELWSYVSGSIGLKREFDTSIEAILNSELGKAVPDAYVSTVDVTLTKISLYQIFTDDFFEIRTTFRVYNVIQKNLLSPFILDARFRNLKADQDITIGSKTFNPAKDFLLDLSDFGTPMSEWKRESVEGSVGYTVEKNGLSSSTEFGLVHFDAMQTIVLPHDTITSWADDDHIIYYTGLNIAEAAGIVAPTAFLIAALIFLVLRSRRNKP